MHRQWYRWRLVGVGSFAFVAVFLVLTLATGTTSATGGDRRRQAPDFALQTLEGRTVRLSALRGKKVVLLNFWATWCPPCRQEMPTLQQLYTDYKKRGLEILAIDSEPAAKAAVRAFVQELRLTFPVLLDPQREVSRQYRVPGLPVSVLIDRDGVIRHMGVGYRNWTDQEAKRDVERLLE
jgi:peroxiredoxin